MYINISKVTADKILIFVRKISYDGVRYMSCLVKYEYLIILPYSISNICMTSQERRFNDHSTLYSFLCSDLAESDS